MSSTITRRDILKFTGGGILGIMFSPLPWKLLDDSAIWTQNWSLTPKLAHGPITAAFSHCTLCSGGCAVKANCVSGMPYFISGIRQHPLTHGSLCARGIAGHHMAHHPLRIVHPHKFTGKSGSGALSAVSLQECIGEIAQQIRESEGTIAILDQQPTRIISDIYRKFLGEISNGVYLTSPSSEDATIAALKRMMDRTSEAFGYDFENADVVLSFGAPLFDGWGTPGRMTAVRDEKNTEFIQIESRYSRTAMQSDEWISLKPGTEKALALSIAYTLMSDSGVSRRIRNSAADFVQFKDIINGYDPERTSSVTGIEPAMVRSISDRLLRAESAIVLSGSDPGGGPFDRETEKAIASLNLLIGNIGRTGGIVVRNSINGENVCTDPVHWSDIPDHSIGVLIVDGSDSGYALPWRLIEKKLKPVNNFVVSLSPILNGISAHSDYLLPSPGHFESLSDVPAPIGSSVETFAFSLPLLKKQEYTTDPIDVINNIAERLSVSLKIPAYEELLKQKTAAIHAQKRGTVVAYSDQRSIPVAEIATADDLWTLLNNGAVWIDGPATQSKPGRFTFSLSPVPPREPGTEGIPLIVYGWRGATAAAQISPILSKVFQEMELRNINGIVSVNPATAVQLGLSKDEPATLSTKNGAMTVRVKIDPTIRPGIIEASVGPLPNGAETPMNPAGRNILNLCEITGDDTWRMTTANLLKV